MHIHRTKTCIVIRVVGLGVLYAAGSPRMPCPRNVVAFVHGTYRGGYISLKQDDSSPRLKRSATGLGHQCSSVFVYTLCIFIRPFSLFWIFFLCFSFWFLLFEARFFVFLLAFFFLLGFLSSPSFFHFLFHILYFIVFL